MTLLQIAILTTFEYFALMLLVCKATSKRITSYVIPISLFALVHVPLVTLRGYINDFLILMIICICIVIFIKFVFNKKLIISMFICLIAMVLPSVVFQTLSIFVLGLVLSGSVGFTFDIGIIVMSSTLLLALLCYLYLPLNRLIRYLRMTNVYSYVMIAAFVAFVLLYILSNTIYFEQFYARRVLMDMLFAITFSFVMVSLCYYLVKFVLDYKAKKSAIKNFEKFEMLPLEPEINLQYYEKHLQAVRWLSHIRCQKKAMDYIDTYFSNFSDIEDEFKDGNKPNLIELDDKILAAYIYVKVKKLRYLGIGCRIKNHEFSSNSKIKTCELIEVIDILINEALEATDKERSNLKIVLGKNDIGYPSIDVYNNNNFLTGHELNRMRYEHYSLRTKKAGDLRKIFTVSEEYDCRLDLRIHEWYDGDYLKFSYIL